MPSRPEVTLQEYVVAGPEAGPYALTAGPDGALWCTLVHQGRVARVTTAGDVTTYPLRTATGGPTMIAKIGRAHV